MQQTNQQNAQSQGWTPAMFASHGLPAPAGTNDNGEPYWVVNGRKISWQQMQQYIWQARQQAQSQTSSGGRGFEAMPNFPQQNFEAAPNSENNVERVASPEHAEQRAESSIERRAEQSTEVSNQAPAKQQAPKKRKTQSVLGHSAELRTVSADDLDSIKDFHHKNVQNPGKGMDQSNTYLAELFGKILRRLIYQGQ